MVETKDIVPFPELSMKVKAAYREVLVILLGNHRTS